MVFIFSMSWNQGSSFHFHRRGDMILARTRENISSGKMKISMSDRLTAEEYFSNDSGLFGFSIISLPFSYYSPIISNISKFINMLKGIF